MPALPIHTNRPDDTPMPVLAEDLSTSDVKRASVIAHLESCFSERAFFSVALKEGCFQTLLSVLAVAPRHDCGSRQFAWVGEEECSSFRPTSDNMMITAAAEMPDRRKDASEKARQLVFFTVQMHKPGMK